MDSIELFGLIQDLKQGEVRLNEPMNRHTTWRIGGPADLFYLPETADACVLAVQLARRAGVPITYLGSGSNVLVSDAGVRGLVVSTALLKDIDWQGLQVEVGAGVPLATLSKACAQRGLAGLEFASGIPGSLGGAVVMNAGAYGSCIEQVLVSAIILDEAGELQTLPRQEMAFAYRDSRLKHRQELLLSVILRLAPGDPQILQGTQEEYLRLRKEKHPLDLPNAGSVFKNPPHTPAGRLIEQAGLKGLRVGDAQISEKHGNFIVNTGQAKAQDVVLLIEEVQRVVSQQFNIRLETEIIRLGF